MKREKHYQCPETSTRQYSGISGMRSALCTYLECAVILNEFVRRLFAIEEGYHRCLIEFSFEKGTKVRKYKISADYKGLYLIQCYKRYTIHPVHFTDRIDDGTISSSWNRRTF
jgi:hypothetical protein